MPCLMKISETKTRRIEDTSRILQLNPKTPVAGHFSLFCPVCTLKEHFTSKSIPPITCSAIFICPGTRWHSSCGAQGIKKKPNNSAVIYLVGISCMCLKWRPRIILTNHLKKCIYYHKHWIDPALFQCPRCMLVPQHIQLVLFIFFSSPESATDHKGHKKALNYHI